jgi:hypothetical protein
MKMIKTPPKMLHGGKTIKIRARLITDVPHQQWILREHLECLNVEYKAGS